MQTNETFPCKQCKKLLSVNSFYINKKRGQRFTTCIICYNIRQSLRPKNKESISRAGKKWRARHPERSLWGKAKNRCKQDGREFNIEVSDIIIPEYCPYLKQKLSRDNKMLVPSLDRINNERGYVKDNIQVISYLANKMKNESTLEQLIQFSKGVLEVHSKAGTGLC